jgi:hypothetical protein
MLEQFKRRTDQPIIVDVGVEREEVNTVAMYTLRTVGWIPG